jgi:general stress protein 26
VSPEGRPQSATVFYWVNDVNSGSFGIYFVTRRSSRKFQAMLANPAVAVVVGTELEPDTLQIEGDATPVEAMDGLHDLEGLHKRLASQPNLQMLYGGAFFPKNPFGKMSGDDFAVMQVKPTWARLMRRNAETEAIEFIQVLP